MWVEAQVALGELVPYPVDAFLEPGSLDGDVKVA
jgi:hypothetical protein